MRCFARCVSMAAEGHSVIVITHKLHEVLEVSDRVTVLRGGRSIGTVDTRRRDGAVARLADGRPGRRRLEAAGERCHRRRDARAFRRQRGGRPGLRRAPRGLAHRARRRGARRRRRRRERPARARRGGHRHASVERRSRQGGRQGARERRSARGHHRGHRAHSGGQDAHGRLAQPQHRVEHRAEVVPNGRRRTVPPPRSHPPTGR